MFGVLIGPRRLPARHAVRPLLRCGGMAVTSAVVTGIVFIVFSDAILTVVYNALGF